MSTSKTLLEEDNVISLRTALILDDGNSVYFRLMPADLEPLIPKGRNFWAPKDFEWLSKDSTWLYRHLRSPSEEQELANTLPHVVENDLKPLVFRRPPHFKLLWSDSGNGVVVYLDGEPWAFIDEATHEAYSKGILAPERGPALGKLWDQQLFERLFPDAPRGIELAKD